MNSPTISTAMESGNGEEWTAAMKAESQSLWENDGLRIRGGGHACWQKGGRNEVGTSCQN